MDTNFNPDTNFVATDCEAFCYEDRDGDGLTDDVDPCIFDSDNDSDGDGVCFSEGDTCYADPADSDGGTDTDGDGWCDDNDNCVDDPNDQANADGDDFGDVCDNCPDDVNNGQEDVDADGIGDACDDCTDVDGDTFCAEDDDCDDNDPDVNPDATEVCNNVDDNCSGTVDDDGACDAQACSTPTTFGSLGPCDDTVSCPGTDAFCYNRLTGSTQASATGICAFELTSGDCSGLTVCTGVGDSACAAGEVCIARGCAATGWACVPVSELCPDPTAI